MNKQTQILKAAEKYAAEHVCEGSKELIDWSNTSLLKSDGVVRHCARMLEGLGTSSHLTLAETLFTKAALRRCAEEIF